MAKLRWEFRAGILAMPEIHHLANHGKTLGLNVEVLTSGRLFKRGWVVASGDDGTIKRYQAVLNEFERSQGDAEAE